jgi:hypothetical protein
MAEWAYLIAAIGILVIGVGLSRAGLVGDTLAAIALAVSALTAFLAAWLITSREAPWIMVPAIILFSVATFVHWRYVLPEGRRRRGLIGEHVGLRPRGQLSVPSNVASWKRWRYLMALSLALSLILVIAVIDPVLGLAPWWTLLLAIALCGLTIASDLALWRRHEGILREQGWDW